MHTASPIAGVRRAGITVVAVQILVLAADSRVAVVIGALVAVLALYTYVLAYAGILAAEVIRAGATVVAICVFALRTHAADVERGELLAGLHLASDEQRPSVGTANPLLDPPV